MHHQKHEFHRYIRPLKIYWWIGEVIWQPQNVHFEKKPKVKKHNCLQKAIHKIASKNSAISIPVKSVCG